MTLIDVARSLLRAARRSRAIQSVETRAGGGSAYGRKYVRRRMKISVQIVTLTIDMAIWTRPEGNAGAY
jgi:hypothetical protein